MPLAPTPLPSGDRDHAAYGLYLHVEVTIASQLLAGEGVPYLIDRNAEVSQSGAYASRLGELPLGSARRLRERAAAAEQGDPA